MENEPSKTCSRSLNYFVYFVNRIETTNQTPVKLILSLETRVSYLRLTNNVRTLFVGAYVRVQWVESVREIRELIIR